MIKKRGGKVKTKTNNEKMLTKSHADTSSNKDKNISTVSRLPFDNNRLENVLILQGGGSLGAYRCGVFKALANNNIKIDIVAGTSIGGINAAIIAGSKDEKHPQQILEQFWLELSESFVDFDKITVPHSSSSLQKFVEGMPASSCYNYYYNLPTRSSDERSTMSANEHALKTQQLKSSYYNPVSKIFKG